MATYSVSFDARSKRFLIWYQEPLTKKRLSKTLYKTTAGKKEPCATREEAERAAKKFMADNAGILSIETEQEAVQKIVTKRRQIAGLVLRPTDLLAKYQQTPAWNPAICEGRKKHIELVMQKFVDYCALHKIETVTTIDAMTVQNWLEQTAGHLSGKTQNEYLAVIRQVFEPLYRELGMTANPADAVRRKQKNSVSREALTAEQFEKLLDGLRNGFAVDGGKIWKVRKGNEYLLAACFGGYCGARLADAVSMTWKNIDLDRREITYTPNKTRKSTGVRVTVPIADADFLALLEEAKKDADTPYCTPYLETLYDHDKAAVSSLFTRAFKAVCGEVDAATEGRARAASVYGFHSLRHTFVSFCANHGVPAEIVASIVGHASTAMTAHYTHISSEAKKRALQGVFGQSLKDRVLAAIGTADDAKLKKILEVLEED